MNGCSEEEARRQFDPAIQLLFYWGAYADKYGGNVQIHEPVGVVGIACPDEASLLAFVCRFAPSVIRRVFLYPLHKPRVLEYSYTL